MWPFNSFFLIVQTLILWKLIIFLNNKPQQICSTTQFSVNRHNIGMSQFIYSSALLPKWSSSLEKLLCYNGAK